MGKAGSCKSRKEVCDSFVVCLAPVDEREAIVTILSLQMTPLPTVVVVKRSIRYRCVICFISLIFGYQTAIQGLSIILG